MHAKVLKINKWMTDVEYHHLLPIVALFLQFSYEYKQLFNQTIAWQLLSIAFLSTPQTSLL